MGCIPCVKPKITITINPAILFIIPNAPIAKSPPYFVNCQFMITATNPAQMWIRKGDKPMAKMSLTILRFNLNEAF